MKAEGDKFKKYRNYIECETFKDMHISLFMVIGITAIG